MTAALSKVEEGEYFDALTLFARVDSYESMLNQIGCLLEISDVVYAAELYRKLISKYGFTHNCFADVARLGECVNFLFHFFSDEAKAELSVETDDKIYADRQLVGLYPVNDDYDDVESSEELLGELLHESAQVGAKERQIYDVNSIEYYDSLRQRLEKAIFTGKTEEAYKLQEQYLAIETDDVSTLEMQQWICLVASMWEEGINFALKLAEMDGVSLRSLGTSVLMLSKAGSQHKSVLRRQLTKLLDYGEEIDDLEMQDYVQIAVNVLDNEPVTLDLAKVLYSHYKDAGCSALKLCARVFAICNQSKLAREAALLLLRAIPWDCYGKLMLNYLNGEYSMQLDGSGEVGIFACFDMPQQFATLAERILTDKLEQGDCVLREDDYLYLDCLVKACRSNLVKGQIESLVVQDEVVCKFLDAFTPQNVQQFVAFIKDSLFSSMSEPILTKNLVHKLLKLGYNDKLPITIGRAYYVLDLSRLKLLTDDVFCEALAVCASIRKVDAARLENAYKRLLKRVDISFDNAENTARRVAYSIMAICYRSFPNKGEGVHFLEGDDQLYLEYILQQNN